MTMCEGLLSLAFVFGFLGVLAAVLILPDASDGTGLSFEDIALFIALFAVAALFAIAAGVWK